MIPLGKFLVKLGYAKEEQIDEALKGRENWANLSLDRRGSCRRYF